MSQVVPGDLLHLAGGALNEAAAGPGLGDRPDPRELASTLLQAHRLVAAMARFADDVADESGMAADRGPLTGAWGQRPMRGWPCARLRRTWPPWFGTSELASRNPWTCWPASSARRPGSSQLCEGIVVSAERVRSCARLLVADAHWSPLVTAASWHWTATAAAITHDACGIMLRSAAEGARHLGVPASLADQVYDASINVG